MVTRIKVVVNIVTEDDNTGNNKSTTTTITSTNTTINHKDIGFSYIGVTFLTKGEYRLYTCDTSS